MPGFVVFHATEILPHDVLAPPFGQLFIAEVEAVLQVLEADHEAYHQTAATDITDPDTSDHHVGAE